MLPARIGRARPACGRDGRSGACAHDLKGAGGDSHAPLRCTKHLCTLGERAQVDWLIGALAVGARLGSAACMRNRPNRPSRARAARRGAFARAGRAPNSFRTLPQGAQLPCACEGSVRKVVRVSGMKSPEPPHTGTAIRTDRKGRRAQNSFRTLPQGAQLPCAPEGMVRTASPRPRDA